MEKFNKKDKDIYVVENGEQRKRGDIKENFQQFVESNTMPIVGKNWFLAQHPNNFKEVIGKIFQKEDQKWKNNLFKAQIRNLKESPLEFQ